MLPWSTVTRRRRLVAGQTVLVTGAAGSIGSELVRQVHGLGPQALYLLDHDESGLHSVQLDLHGHGLFEDGSVILCDIRDAQAVQHAIATAKPDIIFHAAAHKHLPLLERYPSEGIKTNVFGTLHLVEAASAAGVSRFVNISTDKAAEPTSVLGASKRLAELIVAALSGEGMQAASVRFGNVLGSRGSFLHSLAAQVARGQHVTITHPDVTRYFMTIPEAAGLVIEAAVMAQAGETYVLDMGTPVRIVDLVSRFLTATGASSPAWCSPVSDPAKRCTRHSLTPPRSAAIRHRRGSPPCAKTPTPRALSSLSWSTSTRLSRTCNQNSSGPSC